MLLLDDVLRYGFDPEVLLEGLAGHIRQLMVVKDLQMANLVEGSEALKQRYKNQAEANTVASLVTWLDLINEGDVNMVRARNKRLHTEILLLKLTYVSRKGKSLKILHQQVKKKIL